MLTLKTLITKLLNTKATKNFKTGPENVLVINFENKCFGEIYISSIFRCQEVVTIT